MHCLVLPNLPSLFKGSDIIYTQIYSPFHFLQHNQILSYACLCKRKNIGSSFLKEDVHDLVDNIYIYLQFTLCVCIYIYIYIYIQGINCAGCISKTILRGFCLSPTRLLINISKTGR